MSGTWSNDRVIPKPLLQAASSTAIASAPTPPQAISPRDHPPGLTSLLHSIFPTHHPLLSSSHAIEIVTPPSHTLFGFLTLPSTGTRTAFIHLPQPHSSSSRPEHLSANFSEVLRPHDPARPTPPVGLSTLAEGLDIRESLTALLDLAADSLEAGLLVLILDKAERGERGVRELVHELMYAGGQVIRPGGLEGGLEW